MEGGWIELQKKLVENSEFATLKISTIEIMPALRNSRACECSRSIRASENKRGVK